MVVRSWDNVSIPPPLTSTHCVPSCAAIGVLEFWLVLFALLVQNSIRLLASLVRHARFAVPLLTFLPGPAGTVGASKPPLSRETAVGHVVAAGRTVHVKAELVTGLFDLSVIVTEVVFVPATVGVPVISPALLTLRPCGALFSVKTQGALAQDDVSCRLTAVLICVSWFGGALTCGALTTVQVNVAVSCRPKPSVTRTVTGDEDVGPLTVPEIRPLALRLRPDGKVPAVRSHL